jgi:tetratricopeptide (TPR) repeat protein
MKLAGPGLLVVALAGIIATQPWLARTAHAIKERDDVVALPPPAELRVATLGWDAAAVDLLWAKLLVEYGVHWTEHREFTKVPDYADAILALEPTYRPLYRLIDTLLAYRPLLGTEDDVVRARAYLERGMRERPDDAKVWMEYGQFMAFIAPSFLRDEPIKDAWRRMGAEAMAHAVELGADADGALSAATILTREGAREQAIRYLTRIYELTPESSDAHEAIAARLAALAANVERDEADAVRKAVDREWQQDLPFVPRDEYLLLGPAVDPARCAGLDPQNAARHAGQDEGRNDGECARDWPAHLAARGVHGLSELGSSADSP